MFPFTFFRSFWADGTGITHLLFRYAECLLESQQEQQLDPTRQREPADEGSAHANLAPKGSLRVHHTNCHYLLPSIRGRLVRVTRLQLPKKILIQDNDSCTRKHMYAVRWERFLENNWIYCFESCGETSFFGVPCALSFLFVAVR